jgi:hypothetical protein
MLAELELTLDSGVQYSVMAPEDEMKRLAISLAKKICDGERDVVEVRGLTYHNGAPYAVMLNIRTDRLVGAQLRSAEPKYGSDAGPDPGSTAAPSPG